MVSGAHKPIRRGRRCDAAKRMHDTACEGGAKASEDPSGRNGRMAAFAAFDVFDALAAFDAFAAFDMLDALAAFETT